MKHEIQVKKEKCIGCGLCMHDCPAANIRISEQKADVVSNACIMCGHCVAICPKEAIQISGYEIQPIPIKQKPQLDANEILETIRFRRTIRQFQKKDIDDEIIKQILEAGLLTHTAENLRDVSFIVLDKEKEKYEQMAVSLFRKIKPFANLINPLAKRKEITDDFFFFHAPKVILILAKEEINGALAAQNMEFIAEANGLGVLYSGFFAMAANTSWKLKKALNVPKGKKVITTLVLGYPKVAYQRSVPRDNIDVTYL